MGGMAEQQASAAPAATEDSPDGPEETGGGWGRALDAAGIVAGVVLVAIVIDIFSDGRFISRRLHREKGEGPADAPQPDSTDTPG